MNTQKILTVLYTLLLVFGSGWQSIAQTDKELIAQLASEDQDAVNALVLYPEETRFAILEAAQYPEALIKVERIQSRTSTAFRELVTPLPKAAQESIWDLTRYPDLIRQLAGLEKSAEPDIKSILKAYPGVIHTRAKQMAREHMPLLVQIDQLERSADTAVESLLNAYPEQTKEALQQLIALPEVLTLLTDHIDLTILAGDLYSKEPDWVLRKVDSLNLEVARQNAEELEQWRASLENDPEAMEELQASAEAFAEEYEYDDEYYDYDYDYENDDLYYDSEIGERRGSYYFNYHYPYWFGYPYWYSYPRWRLYPYWYDWGFYFGPGQSAVVVGLPSYYFTNWYFYHPHHHYRWTHLSTHFVRHHYGHRGGGGSITASVKNWQIKNRGIITDPWLQDDGRLSKRIKEFGKLEVDRATYNSRNPQKAKSQKEYLEQHQRKYPALGDTGKSREDGNQISKKPATKPAYVPKATRPENLKPQRPTRTKIDQPAKNRTDLNRQKQKSSRVIIPRVKSGKDYHQNKWEQPKQRIYKRPAPKRAAPSKAAVPRKKANNLKKKN